MFATTTAPKYAPSAIPAAPPVTAISSARRRERASSADPSSPVNTATETNADVELNGSTTSDVIPSATSGVRPGIRSARIATASSNRAQNASHVYCLRSFRPSDNGASMTTAAVIAPAPRAFAREPHRHARATTYAITVVAAEKNNTTRRARWSPEPGTSFNSPTNPTGVLEDNRAMPRPREPRQRGHPGLVDPVGPAEHEMHGMHEDRRDGRGYDEPGVAAVPACVRSGAGRRLRPDSVAAPLGRLHAEMIAYVLRARCSWRAVCPGAEKAQR